VTASVLNPNWTGYLGLFHPPNKNQEREKQNVSSQFLKLSLGPYDQTRFNFGGVTVYVDIKTAEVKIPIWMYPPSRPNLGSLDPIKIRGGVDKITTSIFVRDLPPNH